jgi:hypothetical protein
MKRERERDLAGVEAEQDTSNNGGEAEQSMAGLEICDLWRWSEDPSNCNTMRLLRSLGSREQKQNSLFSFSAQVTRHGTCILPLSLPSTCRTADVAGWQLVGFDSLVAFPERR